MEELIEKTWGIMPGQVFGYTLAVFSIAIGVLWRSKIRTEKDLLKVLIDNTKNYVLLKEIIEQNNKEINDLNRQVDDLKRIIETKIFNDG